MTPRINGLIGYFHLEDWWLSAFTQAERQHIKATFQPRGSGSSTLTQGKIDMTSQTADQLLYSLAGWFRKIEQDAVIATKIWAQAELLSDMADPSLVMNRHYLLSGRLNFLLRDHLHTEAASVARKMVEIAQKVSDDFKKRPEFLGNAECAVSHAGYDYLTGKGMLLGVCSADEAIKLCKQAAQQGWTGEWEEKIRGIQDHEKQMSEVWSILNKSPDILQSDFLKQHPSIDSQTLYYAEKRGDVLRAKKGRSYALNLPKQPQGEEK